LGAFALYYDEPKRPTSIHQSLIEQFTHIASIAIERAQSHARLKRSEAFLAEAQHLSSTGSFSWRVETDEITWSEQLYRIFEFDAGVPVTIELIGSRIHPEDAPMWYEMIDRARRDRGDFEYEHRLQMRDHSMKYLHVVAHGTRNPDGQLEYTDSAGRTRRQPPACHSRSCPASAGDPEPASECLGSDERRQRSTEAAGGQNRTR
jgi:PAS domain-containing protein